MFEYCPYLDKVWVYNQTIRDDLDRYGTAYSFYGSILVKGQSYSATPDKPVMAAPTAPTPTPTPEPSAEIFDVPESTTPPEPTHISPSKAKTQVVHEDDQTTTNPDVDVPAIIDQEMASLS